MQAVLLVSPEQVSQDIHVATVSWSGLEQCRHPVWPQSPPLPMAIPPIPSASCHVPLGACCCLSGKKNTKEISLSLCHCQKWKTELEGRMF